MDPRNRFVLTACEAMGTPRGYRSHYLPRTKGGWVALVAFLALFALTQPPVVHGLANRTEAWLLGLPFLYTWLLAVYTALILVLLWALWRGL
jgi:hypothetical protein